MICKRCGGNIDTRRRRSDGSLQCPHCKVVYRTRPTQPQQQRPLRKPQKRKKPIKPIVGLAVLLLLVLILVVSCDSDKSEEIRKVQPYVQVPANNEAAQTESAQESADAIPTTSQAVSETFPLVVYDNNGVRITITGYKTDGLIGDEIEYIFENNSAVSVMFGVGDAFIEGWQITTFGGNTLPAGTKTAGTIDISASNMESCGITKVASVTLKDCHIYNDDTFDTIDTFDIVLNLE